jgi:hypothetical protein
MNHPSRLIVAVLIGLVTPVSVALGQTCDQLKAEIANLQQTLANEQSALDNCNNHLGTCTPGQISGIQQSIQMAQQEIDADQAQLITACPPLPPPNFDHVALQGIEVVQAIQDMASSVTLIAGKTTWVRVYLGKTNGTRTLTATLQAKRGSTTVNLNSAAPITVDAAESLTTRRQNWNKSLNFAVPAAMMSSGMTIFTVGTLTDTSSTQKRIICDDCGMPTQVSFSNMPPLFIRVVSLTYPFQSSPTAPSITVSPRNIDVTLLQSWLGRAYPVARIALSQTTTSSNDTTGIVVTPTEITGTFTCGQVNAQLSAMKAIDLVAGTDERTHYLALVSNQGFAMRGCSPSTTVASGPSGAPGGPGKVPVNVTGDTDASFADWYGGHELAHTFLRDHAGFCNGNDDPMNGKIDPSFPYPNGQISDGTEKSFTGLDVGDTANGIAPAVLWGATTFDIMTYCNQPDWPSAYTYQGIRDRLLIENPGFNLHGQIRQPLTRPMLVGPLVHVVATLNLTKRTGSINYVMPVTRALPSSAPSSRAELVVRNAAEKELFRQSVAIQEMTDTQDGEDRLALIDATIPFREDMAQIQLELDGVVVARYINEQTTPPAVSGVKLTRQSDAEGPIITWNALPASAGKVTFTVQAPGDDNSFVTIAVGLAEPKVTLSTDQAKASILRVTANNGFRNSPPVVIHLCPQLIGRVAKLESEVQNFQEALDNGEIPPPPRTPQRIAKFEAQLRKLERDLAVAEAQLLRCQAQNP